MYLDGIVVIGGWVPELTFPGRGHVGSFDVDLALDARRIRPDGYTSIRKRLLDEGYTQLGLHARVFEKACRANEPRYGQTRPRDRRAADAVMRLAKPLEQMAGFLHALSIDKAH
ncbi:MAG: hypothetical protein AMXMBFR58_27720 [Phycisphaerae bacterium]